MVSQSQPAASDSARTTDVPHLAVVTLRASPSGAQTGPAISSVEPRSARAASILVLGCALCVALVSVEFVLPDWTRPSGSAFSAWTLLAATPLGLVSAALVGLLVTEIYRRTRPQATTPEIGHTLVLLCVAGALMMAIISDSLARAFGIAGAAGIIRFRTPVDDSKDAAVLFILTALGMACGLGTFALAGFGTAMLCGFLLLFDGSATRPPRALLLELIADTNVFPSDHVGRVLAAHGVAVEPRELCQGENVRATFLATCPPDASLDALNADLLSGGSLKKIGWEPAKRRAL